MPNHTTYYVPEATPTPAPTLETVHNRYQIREVLGRGGMGEVWRVDDLLLCCPLAMKVIHAPIATHADLVARFQLEARLTARLQHPGIVPVHDLGVLPDGRVYYTMMCVEGERLTDVIHQQKQVSGPDLFRLVSILAQVSDTIAYAHANGVLHRDLKPDNIMLGSFGRVLVLDWGIARVLAMENDPMPMMTPSVRATVMGSVAGTPGYMAPEQARGEIHRLGPQSDVYALGGILWEILTGMAPHLHEKHPQAAEGLEGIAWKALQALPEDRYPHAGAFAEALRAWMDGSLRRARARERLQTARQLQVRLAERETKRPILSEMPVVPPGQVTARMQELQVAWALEEEAQRFEEEYSKLEAEFLTQLEQTLQEAPDLEEARLTLLSALLSRHKRAEAQHDPNAAGIEARLRLHNRGEYDAYLSGTGHFQLATARPARVRLATLSERHRRRIAEVFADIGTTPISQQNLPIGSHLAILQPEDGPPVLYPIYIERLGNWQEASLPLPRHGELGPDDIYVPQGPFIYGGDTEGAWVTPQSVESLAGFVIKRHPVTCAEYLAFLQAHVRQGLAIEPLLPKSSAWQVDAEGWPQLGVDADGDRWNPAWPICYVSFYQARQFAEWVAVQSGLPWRLPSEKEWEKAARGVDGRRWPWGNGDVPGFSAIRGTCRTPVPIEDFPNDVSVYGVRGLAGNVRCWCSDIFAPPELISAVFQNTHQAVRGGSWTTSLRAARSARRNGYLPHVFMSDLGIRLVRTWGETL